MATEGATGTETATGFEGPLAKSFVGINIDVGPAGAAGAVADGATLAMPRLVSPPPELAEPEEPDELEEPDVLAPEPLEVDEPLDEELDDELLLDLSPLSWPDGAACVSPEDAPLFAPAVGSAFVS